MSWLVGESYERKKRSISMRLQEHETVKTKKPCPFCGRYPEHKIDEYGGHQLFCDGESHYCSVGSFKTEQEAIDEWNKRA